MKEKNTVMRFSELSRANAPYIFIWIIYYAWIIAFTTWWTASAQTDQLLGADLRAILHSINLISSAVFISFYKKEWFVRLARVGAVVIVTSMTLFMLVDNPVVNLVCALVSGVFFGIVNDSILMPFVFALNNSEKLFAVAISNTLIPILTFIQILVVAAKGAMALSYGVMFVALLAVWFFKKEAVEGFTQPEKAPPRRIYLTVLFSGAFAILSKGVGKGLLNIIDTHGELELWYTGASLAGALLIMVIFLLFDNSILLSWNITFACLAIGLMFNAFADKSNGLAVVFAVLLGMGNAMGMICMYYIVGVVGKKYASMPFVRRYVIIIGLCGVVGVFLGRYVNNANSEGVSIFASIVSTAVMVVFLMMSGSISRTVYGDSWAKEAQLSDVDFARRGALAKYKLTAREEEVCRLLLEGNTLRQTAGELKISYPTVNTYCTSLYRKLGINSRTELLVMFKDLSEQE